MSNGLHKWETILIREADNRIVMERCTVPSGWLYRTTTYSRWGLDSWHNPVNVTILAEQVTFVPAATRARK